MIAALTTGASHRTPPDKTDQLDLVRAPQPAPSPAWSLAFYLSVASLVSCSPPPDRASPS